MWLVCLILFKALYGDLDGRRDRIGAFSAGEKQAVCLVVDKIPK